MRTLTIAAILSVALLTSFLGASVGMVIGAATHGHCLWLHDNHAGPIVFRIAGAC